MVTNISAYRFASLDGLKTLRAALMEACQKGGLKGTILLSTEGINLFVAGPAAAIASLLEVVRAVPGATEAKRTASTSGRPALVTAEPAAPAASLPVETARLAATAGRPSLRLQARPVVTAAPVAWALSARAVVTAGPAALARATVQTL